MGVPIPKGNHIGFIGMQRLIEGCELDGEIGKSPGVSVTLQLLEQDAAEELPGSERGGSKSLSQHPFGGIAQLVAGHIFPENDHRMRLDDALEQVDHTVHLPKGLRFGLVERVEGGDVRVVHHGVEM